MSRNALSTIRETKNKNIAFVVETLTGKEYLIDICNELVNLGFNCTFFYLENKGPYSFVDCAVEQLDNIWAYSGHIFVFNLWLARYLCRCPAQKKIYFFDPEMSWTKLPQPLYYDMAHVYLHNRLTLLAPPQQAEIIGQVWKNCGVIQEFNAESIKNLIGEKNE